MNSLAKPLLLALARRLKTGELTIEEGGRVYRAGPGGIKATIRVNDIRAWRMAAGGVHGAIAAYRQGLWESPDLAAVIRLAARNAHSVDGLRRRLGFIRVAWRFLRSGYRRNDPATSRRDIAAHYDIGNEMFSLMLDPTMMYSCAVFETSESTLNDASLRKLELICEKLELGPRDNVIEIGTGWGGFAIYAATRFGCRVTTTTISEEQYKVATQRVRDAGVDHLVEVVAVDYRALTGTFDKLVSIEMIEAVGHRDFGTFFECCSRLLTPNGIMLLQASVIDDRHYDVAKTAPSFIRTYIFPNGCLPSPGVIAESLAQRTDMRMLHLEDFTPHYAETLRRWRANFDSSSHQIEALGLDARFGRIWRLYLAYCEAGFDERRMALVQMVIAKPGFDTDRVGFRDSNHSSPATHKRTSVDLRHNYSESRTPSRANLG